MNSPPQIPGLVYVQPLGSGGYADVYLYEQQSPRMPVAVKVLKAGSLTDRLKAEFFAEADTMAELGDHPYIVQVFRAGAATDGRPYLVMKYYPPPNLAQRSRTERFPVADVLRIGIQLASAVETAHQANVIHRDIKPANVLVSAYGAPGLTDFGIAGRGLRTHADAALHGVSGREEIGVSVPWSPPEVIYAESDGDARSDVYSLAATLWQLLAGRSPFEVPGQDNTAYALMPRIRTQPVPATGRPDVPPAVERVLATAMAKDPGHRPPTAMAFALELQAVEQELRLPRTQILVLDDRGRTRLTRPGAPGVGSAAGQDTSHGADDRTHIKGPQRVQAQAPVAPSAPVAPAPVVLPTPAPAAPPMAATAYQASGMPGMPGMPDTVGTAGTAGTAPAPSGPLAATGLPPVPAPPRPRQPGSAQPAPAAQQGASAQPPAAPHASAAREIDTATPMQPLRVDPASVAAGSHQDAGMPSAAAPSRSRLPLVAGLVVVAALVGGFIATRSGSSATDQPKKPVMTLQPTDGGNALGEGVFEAPAVTAEPQAAAVRFTWNYPQQLPTDTFQIKVGATPEAARAASPVTVSTKLFSAPASTGQSVCVVVTVVRGGQLSPSSLATCGTAS